MNTKHTPATPLPWTDAQSRLTLVSIATTMPKDVAFMPPACDKVAIDLSYIAHAANAYPRLIEALRGVLAKDGIGLRTTGELPARALLRELGEE